MEYFHEINTKAVGNTQGYSNEEVKFLGKNEVAHERNYRQEQLVSISSDPMTLPSGAIPSGIIHLVVQPVKHQLTPAVSLMAPDS